MGGHEEAMRYLNDIGIEGAPDIPRTEIPTWEQYFLSKCLEELIDSGKDVLTKTFELDGQDGLKFRGEFRLENITFVPPSGETDK